MANVYEVVIDGQTYEAEGATPEEAEANARYVVGRRADAAPIQEHQRSLPARFGKGIADAPRRLGESFQQLGAALGEAVGYYPEGTVAEQTREMNMRRLIQTGGDEATDEAADVGEAALTMFPVIGAAGLGRKTATEAVPTFLRQIGRVSAQGAAESALLFPANENATVPADVFRQRAIAAGLSMGITAPVAAYNAMGPAIHNYIGRLAANSEKSEEVLKARRKAGGWLDRETLMVSQETGSEISKALQLKLASTKSKSFLVSQIDRQMRRWDAMVRWVGKGSKNPADVSFLATARKLSNAWQASEQAAQSAASRTYGNQLGEVFNLGRKDPSPFPVGFSNLSAVTDEIATGSGGRDWWRSLYGKAAEAPAGAIRELDDYIKAIKAEPGFTQGLSVAEIARLRGNLSRMDSEFYQATKQGPDVDPDTLARHAVLRKIIRAVDADIDALVGRAAPGQSAAGDALRLLRDANKEYSEFKDFQDYMRQTATAQWFGGFQPADAEKFLVELAKKEPVQQQILIDTLMKGGPEGKDAILALRQGLIRQAINAGRAGMIGQPASEGAADLVKVGRAMIGDNLVLGERIFTPGQYTEIQKGLAAIRVLEEAPKGSSVNRAPDIESGVMAGASQNPAFLSRMVWRIIGTKRLENLLLTKEGLQSLKTIADYSRRTSLPFNRIPANQKNEWARAVAHAFRTTAIPGDVEIPPELMQLLQENGGFGDGQ